MSGSDEIYYDSLSAEVTAGVFRILMAYGEEVAYDKFSRDMYEGKDDPHIMERFGIMKECPVKFYAELDKNTRVKFCNVLQKGTKDDVPEPSAKKQKKEEN